MQFIDEMCVDENSIIYKYIKGKTKRNARQCANMMRLRHKRWLKAKEDAKNNPEDKDGPATDKTSKKLKTELTTEEKEKRYSDLITRLKTMKVDIRSAKLDFPDTPGYNYIHGVDENSLGKVAGMIWRENKPVFTGISNRTTRRASELDRL